MSESLSGFVTASGEHAYFFSDDQYVRYDVAADGVESGYPRGIAESWPGLPSRVDAPLLWTGGAVYFLHGRHATAYDMVADRAQSDPPQLIAELWPGVFPEGVDAALLWPGGEVAYFFKGSEYVKFDLAVGSVPEGYPRAIAGAWTGVFEQGVDAVVLWPDGDVFFFSGDSYVKYDVAADRAYEGYPRPVAGSWTGLPIGSAAPAPVEVATYGRLQAGLDRVPDALGHVTSLRSGSGASPWQHLDRSTVAAGIETVVNDPDTVQQGANGLCTTAAFVNIWAQDAPDAYAAFAAALFENGEAELASSQGSGGTRIVASEDLRASDYSAIAAHMKASGFAIPSQADWMVLSAIRDSSNLVFDFTGDPQDWVSSGFADGAAAFSGDLEGWMADSAAWSAVVADENAFFDKDLAHAQSLDPAKSRCVLNIDVALLNDSEGRHTVVLRSPVTQSGDGRVHLKVWTWARVEDIDVTQEKFEDNYYGACTAQL